MNKILLIIAVALLVGCKTENIYLSIYPMQMVTEITDTIYVVPDNRFTMEFQRADSIVKKASDEAMKSAIFKFKQEKR